MQDNDTTSPAENPNPTPAPSPTPPEISPAPGATPVVPPVPSPAPETTTPNPASSTEPLSSTPPEETTGAQAATAPAATAHVPGAKNHLVAVLLSIFVGSLGVDRFYLGHIGLGVAKLLLSWLTFGIWWLIDVILIATRKVKNVTWES